MKQFKKFFYIFLIFFIQSNLLLAVENKFNDININSINNWIQNNFIQNFKSFNFKLSDFKNKEIEHFNKNQTFLFLEEVKKIFIKFNNLVKNYIGIDFLYFFNYIFNFLIKILTIFWDFLKGFLSFILETLN